MGLRDPQRLPHHVLDAAQFQYGSHGPGGYDAGAFAGGLDEHDGRALLDRYLLRDGAAPERQGHHLAAGHGVPLAHGVWDSQRLAQASAHGALSIAHHYQGVEPQASAPFHHLGDAPGIHHPLGEPAGVFFTRSALTWRAPVPGATPPSVTAAFAAAALPVLSRWPAAAWASPALSAASAWWGLYHPVSPICY